MPFLRYPVFSLKGPNVKIDITIYIQKNTIVEYQILVYTCILDEFGSSCGLIANVQTILTKITKTFNAIKNLDLRKKNILEREDYRQNEFSPF